MDDLNMGDGDEKGSEFIDYIGKSSHQGTVSHVTT